MIKDRYDRCDCLGEGVKEILQITWIFSRRCQGDNEQEMQQNVIRMRKATVQLFKEMYQNVKRMRRANTAVFCQCLSLPSILSYFQLTN